MTLDEFRRLLEENPGRGVRMNLGGGRAIADHFHVTEVGRVEKRFVDCGGGRRSSVSCVLQTLVADDTDHRLSTDKLARILSVAESVGLPGGVEVAVEHQERSISTDTVASAAVRDGVLEFQLAARQTACLAGDRCGISPPAAGPAAGLTLLDDGCSGAAGCC